MSRGPGLPAADARPLRAPEDVVSIRQAVRQKAVVTIEALAEGTRRGLRLVFEDEGPGIDNIDQAMTDGVSTGGGLGLGLGGARRLSNDFSIDSAPGRGTRVTIVRWT